MSVQASTWAWEQRIGANAKFVLVALANAADTAGVTFIGQEEVARVCGIRRDTVGANMGKLEQAGLIGRYRRQRPNGSRTTDLVLLAPGWHDRGGMFAPDQKIYAELPSAEPKSEIPPLAEAGDHIRTTAPPNGEQQRLDNTSLDAAVSAPQVARDGGSAVMDIFERWKFTFGKNGQARMTPGRRQKINARLAEGYTVERICAAIDGCARSSWHVEHGYTDLTLILRSGEKLEQFEAMPAAPERTDAAFWRAQAEEWAREEANDPS